MPFPGRLFGPNGRQTDELSRLKAAESTPGPSKGPVPAEPSTRRRLPTIGVPLGCLLVAIAIVAGGMLITIITSLGR